MAQDRSVLTEEDSLLLKKVEVHTMRLFNSYRVPFMAIMMTLCIGNVMNRRRSIPMRLVPCLVFIPFIGMYNHHVGIYGVHKNIDEVFDIIKASKSEDSKVRSETLDFLKQR